MPIRTKNSDPTLNEFSTNDIMVNVEAGTVFYKSKDKLYKLTGDDILTSTNEQSEEILITGSWILNGSDIYYNAGMVSVGGSDTYGSLNVITGSQTPAQYGHIFIYNGSESMRLGQQSNYGWIQTYSSKPLYINPIGNNVIIGSDNETTYVGIRTTTPQAHLHIATSGSEGDATIWLEADTNNNNENSNPGIKMSQDNGLVAGWVGFTGNTSGRWPDGSTCTDTHQNTMVIGMSGSVGVGANEYLQLITENKARLTITNGDATVNSASVGIGTINPNGILHLYEDIGTAAGPNGIGSLVIEHASSSTNYSSITFPSSTNRNSDYGYIQYDTDNTLFGNSDENSLLTLGVENDGTGDHEDAVRVKINTINHLVMRGGDERSTFISGSLLIADKEPYSSSDNLKATGSYAFQVKTRVDAYAARIENYSHEAKGLSISIGPFGNEADGNADEPGSGNNNFFLAFSDQEGSSLGSFEAEEGGSCYFNENSDERLKMNIRSVKDHGIKDLLNIKVREFEWKRAPGKKNIGFIAQEIEKVYPYASKGEANHDPKTNPMTLVKSEFIPLIVKSIQDQQEQIDNLKERVKKLESKIK